MLIPPVIRTRVAIYRNLLQRGAQVGGCNSVFLESCRFGTVRGIFLKWGLSKPKRHINNTPKTSTVHNFLFTLNTFFPPRHLTSKMTFKTIATIASFGGKLLKLTHDATSTSCEMALNLYLPPQAAQKGQKIPVLFYLSGLTCTGDNCAEKGFFQYGASQKGIAIVYPDTSPRKSPLPPRGLPMLKQCFFNRRAEN